MEEEKKKGKEGGEKDEEKVEITVAVVTSWSSMSNWLKDRSAWKLTNMFKIKE